MAESQRQAGTRSCCGSRERCEELQRQHHCRCSQVGNRTMPAVINSRNVWSVFFSLLVGLILFLRTPFPQGNNLLQLILLEKPSIFYGIQWAYIAMLFTTPLIGFSLLFSLAYIFIGRNQIRIESGKLPVYPEVADRNKLALVIGEIHHARQPGPAENPRWLVIPERGLF